MIRPHFSSVRDYGATLGDTAFWGPYVAAICARHQIACERVRSGLIGTNAVFLVDERYAVKIYPELFDGARSFPTERACYALVAAASGIPAPALVAAGELFEGGEGWGWPYLITTLLPGESLGESQASYADRQALAIWLGRTLRRIHALPIGAPPLAADWAGYRAFLERQRDGVAARHAAWGDLPHHLLGQVEQYLPPAAALADWGAPPALLHGDLNRDHVLGSSLDGRWRPSGLIDFGDARVGDPAYDLVALHLGLFDADKRLLAIFLEASGDVRLSAALPQRAMALTLLHEFAVLGDLGAPLDQVATIEELAALLWDPAAPGIGERR